MYPNPATDILSIWFENKENEPLSYAIYNFQGMAVKEEENATAMNSNKLNVDVSKLRRGNYLLKFQIGGKLVTKAFTVE
jgi:hypothetical protein